MRSGRWRYLVPPDLAAGRKTSRGRRAIPASSAALGYPASVIMEIARTIERKLIRTLRLVEWGIPRFRNDCLSLSEGTGQARSAMVSAAACDATHGPDGTRLETLRISRCIMTS